MRYLKSTILSLCISLSISALGLDVTTSAGHLAEVLGDNLNVTTLKVKGQINAADFEFINYQLKDLRSLDLSEATIAAYDADNGRLLTGKLYSGGNILPNYALTSSGITSLALPANLKKIGEGSLAASGLTSIVIPASVNAINDDAFSGCKSLESVTIPATVNVIGNGVFKDCVNLKSATIQSSMTTIPASMFEGCESLTSIAIPSTVTEFGANAFANCSKLDDVNFPSGLTSIGSMAFYNTALENVNISQCSQLTAIGDYAFAKCADLVKLEMAPDVKFMGQGVFFDDASLAETSFPMGVTSIPAFTFKGNSSLTNATALLMNINQIGDYALTGMSAVTEVCLPGTLNHIGTEAMADWTSLKEIDGTKLPTVPTLGNFVWDNVDQENVILYVDSLAIEQFENTPQWQEFTIKGKQVDDVNNILAADDSGIEFRVSGQTVRVISAGAPIVEVLVYDLAGRRCISETASAQVVEIDVATLKSQTFVVYAVLEDGTRAAVKLIL